MKRNLMKKIMYLPFKKVGKSLTNIVVFDLAMSLYQFAKAKFLTVRHQEDQNEEKNNDDFVKELKKRRW